MRYLQKSWTKVQDYSRKLWEISGSKPGRNILRIVPGETPQKLQINIPGETPARRNPRRKLALISWRIYRENFANYPWKTVTPVLRKLLQENPRRTSVKKQKKNVVEGTSTNKNPRNNSWRNFGRGLLRNSMESSWRSPREFVYFFCLNAEGTLGEISRNLFNS